MSADVVALAPGASTLLTATANVDVGPTPYYIEIFDVTFSEFLGECAYGVSCSTYVSEPDATTHYFIAYISDLDYNSPPSNIQAASNLVGVTWLGIDLFVNQSILGVGSNAQLTADTNADVGPTPYYIEIFDQSTQQLLGYCGSGSSCSVYDSSSNPTTDTVIAYISDLDYNYPPSDIQATSNQVSVSWVSLSLSSNVSSLARGNTATLTATASIDVGPTPYDIEIFDQTARTIVGACSSGTACLVSDSLSIAGTHTFIAYVSDFGTAYPPPSIVVTSNTYNVMWFLWGVDTVNQITTSNYNSIVQTFGMPDFFGRYIGLGSYPYDMTSSEVTFAHSKQFAILPVYSDYNPVNVTGYSTGQTYATTAITAAQQFLHISQKIAVFVDIEAGSNPDSNFIKGWYDRFNSTFTYTYKNIKYRYQAGYYKAGYYGNTTSQNTFTYSYCNAVSSEAQIGTNSFIWTPQPSVNISASTTRAASPQYGPIAVSCSQIPAAWQYGQQGSQKQFPNVDLDEALANLPLWHP